jgi:hypothetical protein
MSREKQLLYDEPKPHAHVSVAMRHESGTDKAVNLLRWDLRLRGATSDRGIRRVAQSGARRLVIHLPRQRRGGDEGDIRDLDGSHIPSHDAS